MDDDVPLVLRACGWIGYPVKPPVSTIYLTFFRTFTILFIIFTFMASLLTLIVHPWKIESYEGRSIELDIWKICTVTPEEPLVVTCYSQFYNDEDTEAWFYAFRYMMVISATIQFFVFCCIIILTTFKSDRYKKPWPILSYSLLLAGCLTFCSLIVFHIEFEFGFAEGARIIMEWTEETDIEETVGYPYTLSWCTVGAVWLCSYLCYYTKCVEEVYLDGLDEFAVERKLLNNQSQANGSSYNNNMQQHQQKQQQKTKDNYLQNGKGKRKDYQTQVDYY